MTNFFDSDHVSFRRGHLGVEQIEGVTERLPLSGDLLILVSSWERRCTQIAAAAHRRYTSAAVVRFAERGSRGLRETHDGLLTQFAGDVADRVQPLPEYSSLDVTGWRDALCELLIDAAKGLGRALDVVVDLTCLPKYYALTILGFAIRAGLIRRIVFFYAAGRYALPPTQGPLIPIHSFTEGQWRSFQVPYLEGELNLDRKVRILAAIGFETFQARNFIAAYEAERHELLMPSPGFSPLYEDRGEAETRALATFLDLSMDAVIRVPAWSVNEMANETLRLVDGTDQYNDLALCLGTKPQALGVGIAALIRPQMTVVCRVPSRYAETDTPASGRAWTYTITDLSIPSKDF